MAPTRDGVGGRAHRDGAGVGDASTSGLRDGEGWGYASRDGVSPAAGGGDVPGFDEIGSDLVDAWLADDVVLRESTDEVESIPGILGAYSLIDPETFQSTTDLDDDGAPNGTPVVLYPNTKSKLVQDGTYLRALGDHSFAMAFRYDVVGGRVVFHAGGFSNFVIGTFDDGGTWRNYCVVNFGKESHDSEVVSGEWKMCVVTFEVSTGTYRVYWDTVGNVDTLMVGMDAISNITLGNFEGGSVSGGFAIKCAALWESELDAEEVGAVFTYMSSILGLES